MKIEIEVPDELRAETRDLLQRFSQQLANRLLLGQRHRSVKGMPEWDQAPWETEARLGLLRNVGDGDHLDIACYAMFMWERRYRPSLKPALMFFDLDKRFG